MIRLLLVDDHELVRSALRCLLEKENDFEVVAEAASGEEALRLARELSPDVVLMDISMPGMGGLEATRRLLATHPDTRVIGVTMYEEEPYPSRMLEAGAAGYLPKNCATEELAAAIRQVMMGKSYVASSIASRLAVSLIKGSGGSAFDRLSQREMQVALMVTQGRTTQAISDTLCLSPKTVSTYRYRVFEKLGVHNDVELTRLAMRYGLLEERPRDTG